jgi:hypothetical protein
MSVETPSPRPAESPDGTSSGSSVSSGLTKRALFIGAVMSVLLTIWALHSAYTVGASRITLTHLPVAALFPFLVVVMLLNPALKILNPRYALSRHELIVVFFLVLTASAIPAWVFSSYWLSTISGPNYYANPENQWVATFFEYLPGWLIIADDANAVKWFYESIPRDETLSSRAIMAWAIPLFWWMSFYFAIFVIGVSSMVMLRKQWVEHERLTFPLAQIPLLIVEGTEGSSLLPTIARSRLFWYGFGFTLALHLWNIVGYFGFLPPIPIGMDSAGLGVGTFTLAKSFPAIPLKFSFLAASVAYFTNLNVLSSMWIFYLIMVVQQGLMTRIGVPNVGAVVKSQHAGGFLIFVLFSLWAARRHLRDVFMKAFGKAPHVDDSSEFFSYRKAVFGVIFSLVYIGFWLHATGMSWGIIAFMMGSLLLMFIGVTRIVAETGLVFLDLPYEAHDLTVQVIGSGSMSPQDITTVSLGEAFARNWRTLGMCAMAHIAKVDDEVGGTGKGTFGAISFALGLALITAVGFTLYLGYEISGASNFIEPAFKAGATRPFNNVVKFINNRQALTGTELGFLGIGSVVSTFLMLAHHRLAWWGLHPIGFAVVKSPFMNSSIMAIFTVWVIKSILLRIGGIELFRKTIPIVMGVLVAFVLSVFLSYAVDLVWFPQSGHILQTE